MREQHDDRPIARGSTLDWAWDWTDWMRPGDSIATAGPVTATSEITAAAPTAAGPVVTAMLTCSADAPIGSRQYATCSITTTAGRTDSRTIRFIVTAR